MAGSLMTGSTVYGNTVKLGDAFQLGFAVEPNPSIGSLRCI